MGARQEEGEEGEGEVGGLEEGDSEGRIGCPRIQK